MRSVRGVGSLTVLILATGACGAAETDSFGYRRFTEHLSDTNRSNRIVYVPLASSYPGRAPANMPYDTAAAFWADVTAGQTSREPRLVQDGARYVLERMDRVAARETDSGHLRVVVARYGSSSARSAVPRLDVVHTGSLLGSSAAPTRTENISGGIRFVFDLPAPEAGVAVRSAAVARARGLDSGAAYAVYFLPEQGVRAPRSVVRAPTFGGMDIQSRMSLPPPRVPATERVAGSRQEFRNESSGNREKR